MVALHRAGLGASALCVAALGMVLLVVHRPMVLDESKALALVGGRGTQQTFSKLPASDDASEDRALKLASGQGSLQKTFSTLPARDDASEERALKLASGQGSQQKTFSKLPASDNASEGRALKLASGAQGSLKRFSQLVRALPPSHHPAGECPPPVPSP